MSKYSLTSKLGLPHSKDMELLHEFVVSGCDDRTLAIIHVSYIEKYLSRHVQRFMPALNSALKRKLFRPDGLLGTLGAKNDIAKALGALVSEDHATINVLGHIRNKFAHHIHISSFEHDDLSEYINQLVLPIHLIKADDQIKEAFARAANREKFNMVCMLLNGALHNSMALQPD